VTDTRLASLLAYEALDSRGRPTVGCVARLADGSEAETLVPAGASTGRHEARERRDGGERYQGRGVRDAVNAVNGEIAAALAGWDVADQDALDARLVALDGTPTLERLGANAVLAVSVASLRAAAVAAGVPLWSWVAGDRPPLLPLPMVNILSGGAHAGGAVDVQDYLVIPIGAASFAQAMEWATRVREAVAQLLRESGGNPDLVADEGGLAHPFADNTAGLTLLTSAIERAGLLPGEEAAIALDVAATQLVTGERRYRLAREQRDLSSDELVELVAQWCRDFPIVSVEDPVGEDDWDGFATATTRCDGVQLIGDDLFATNAQRLQRGVDLGAATCVLAKINQNGTVSGTRKVVELARDSGYGVVVSARSGETEDSTIADLAVGWRAGQLKVGSMTRSERTAKWNRLLRLEAQGEVEYAGSAALVRTARR
jgi:enolase